MVARDVRGVRPGGKQAAGQVGLLEAAGQRQARLDERQRGAGLPLAQQDGGSLMQQVGDQVLIAGGAGNSQRLLAVILGDRVTARRLEEGGPVASARARTSVV